MQVYHCGRNIFVPQEFLNGPDIIAILEKMCSKAVPKGMCTDLFLYFNSFDSSLDRLINNTWINMMPSDLVTSRIF